MDLVNHKPVNGISIVKIVKYRYEIFISHKLFWAKVYDPILNVFDCFNLPPHFCFSHPWAKRAGRYSFVQHEGQLIINQWEEGHKYKSYTFASHCRQLERQALSTASRYETQAVFARECCIDQFQLVLPEWVKPHDQLICSLYFFIPREWHLPLCFDHLLFFFMELFEFLI